MQKNKMKVERKNIYLKTQVVESQEKGDATKRSRRIMTAIVNKQAINWKKISSDSMKIHWTEVKNI